MSGLSFNPIITFGKYKGQLNLQNLEAGYLQYIVHRSRDQGHDFFHGGTNWTQLALAELKRRKDGTPVEDPGVALGFPVEDEHLVDLESTEEGDRPPRFDVSHNAVDEASLLLLKEFITRSNKETGFLTWLVLFAKESIRCGAVLNESTTESKRVHYAYYGFLLEFEGRSQEDNVLFHIAKNPFTK